MQGIVRMQEHPKGHGWEHRPRDVDLERLAWTFHRAWIDRYGWRSTTVDRTQQ